MQVIPLSPIPNQVLTVRIETRLYNIAVRETEGCMSVDIVRDGETLVTGMRASSGTALLPYRYLEDMSGNISFLTSNEEEPFYDRFGVDQFLIYASNAELESIRAGT